MGQAASDKKGDGRSELKQDQTGNGNSAQAAFKPQISRDLSRQNSQLVPHMRVDRNESLTKKLKRMQTMQTQSSLEEPLVGAPVSLARSNTVKWITKVQPQTQYSDHVGHVVSSKGQHLWCCDHVWDEVASCVVFDLFNCHVWSRPLAAMSLLALMVGLSNYTLVSLLPIAMSASCIGARDLGSCNSTVCADNDPASMTIPIDPEFLLGIVQSMRGVPNDDHHDIQSMKQLKIGWDVNLWLILFGLVYIANSAYRMHARTCLGRIWRLVRIGALFTGAIWLQAMLDFTEKDVYRCDSTMPTKEIEWTQYEQNSGVPEWPKNVAEFCSLDATQGLLAEDRNTTSTVSKHVKIRDDLQNDTLDRDANLVGEEVKNVWAAWMNIAKFNVTFVSKSEARAYCEQLSGSNQPALVACVSWMNNTNDYGNRIECLHDISKTISDDVSNRVMLQMMLGGKLDLTSFNDIDYLDELATAGCHAIIAGSNFALKPPSKIQDIIPWPRGFVAQHILSLATQGLYCSEYDTIGSGPRPAKGSSVSTCTYSHVLLQKRGSKLELNDNVGLYLHHEFVESIITQVDKCADQLYAFDWTTLASYAIYFFVAMMGALYVWMMFLRLGASTPTNRLIALLVSTIWLFSISGFSWSVPCTQKECWNDDFSHVRRNKLLVLSIALLLFHVLMSQLGQKFWPVPSCAWGSIHMPEPENEGDSIGVLGQSGLLRMRCSERLRTIFSSRVLLGFALSTLLQGSFTYAMTIFVFPLADNARNSCPDDFCKNGIYFGSRGAVYGQCAIVLIAIVWNTQRYLWLRQHIMALPYDVIFGEETNMEYKYYGPDLVDFKDMASSSALLAMQFPGMLFWHFLIGSWALVAVLGLIIVPIVNSIVGFNPTAWLICKTGSILGALHFANYLTRLYVQRCVLHQPGYALMSGVPSRSKNDVHIRCACFFTLWELWSLALGLAVGPVNALYDFIFGLLTSTISKMIVDKPNYVQFGELSDYVYCSYCALLYLERVREEGRQRDMMEQANDSEVARSTSKAQDFEPEVERSGYRSHCPCWCCGFCLFQLAIPILMISFITWLGWVLPAFPPGLKKYNEL